MRNIAVFASGSGTNCENIIRYFRGHEQVRVALVLCNKADALVVERARLLGVDVCVVPKAEFNREEIVLPLLRRHHVDFIVLAGFLLMVPRYLLIAFPRAIINIHPSLLPRHGGKGMWGMHVHEAVKAAGDRETGMTVHWVSEVCDGGEIIAQFSTPLDPADTPHDIAAREHRLEMEHFPRVIEEVLLDGATPHHPEPASESGR